MDLRIEDENLDEQLEHIPWSDLSVSSPGVPRWALYLVAGVLAVAALGVMVGRTVFTRPTNAVLPAASTVPVPASFPETTVAAPIAVPEPDAPALYSEADLMAIDPGRLERLAVVRAETFVRSYFSTGGHPAGSLAVVAALPDGAVIPAGDGGISYVEWARAFRVDPIDGTLYRVGVLFGMLAGPDGATMTRLDPQAVDVVVRVDEQGAAVVDLPMPAEIPAAGSVSPWPEASVDVPEEIAVAAAEQSSAWGADPKVVEGSHGTDGWRVVVLVSDAVGNRWPMAVWINPSGSVLEPPWQVDD